MVESETQEEKPAKEGSDSKGLAENTGNSKGDHGEVAKGGKDEGKEKRKRGRQKKEDAEANETKEVKEEEKGKGKKAKKESEPVERKEGERRTPRERKAVERFSVPGSPKSSSGKKAVTIVQVHYTFFFSWPVCFFVQVTTCVS